jgi:ADP-ribosyl-[dinitrogen reductase] hydrolase
MTDEPNVPSASDRFTGCLLGLAIGDALALPTISGIERRAPITGYEPLRAADGDELVLAGQFTAHTELALCLVESLVTANGFVDPQTAGFRFVQVLSSDHGHLLDPTTRSALQRASETAQYQAGIATDGPVEPGPAARIASIGLVHTLGRLNSELFVREVMRATLITHADPEAVNGALAMAYAVNLVTRRELPPELLIAEILSFIDEDAVARRLRVADAALLARSSVDDDASALERIGSSGSIGESIARALYLFCAHQPDFERGVLAAANSGVEAPAVAAMTGALLGAWAGIKAIPASLVDGLDGRMYFLMASPALFRTAQRRAGLFLQLHQRP